ncbi:CopG family transcriptional regulator [bacterium]|nr:CopG family transcriptional regulator [bacterium]
MQKTITVRIDEEMYSIIKKAAQGEKRTISNFLEYATLSYITNEMVVDDHEMEEILLFEKEINKGIEDVKAGRCTVID